MPLSEGAMDSCPDSLHPVPSAALIPFPLSLLHSAWWSPFDAWLGVLSSRSPPNSVGDPQTLPALPSDCTAHCSHPVGCPRPWEASGWVQGLSLHPVEAVKSLYHRQWAWVCVTCWGETGGRRPKHCSPGAPVPRPSAQASSSSGGAAEEPFPPPIPCLQGAFALSGSPWVRRE